jgi:cGMP-dependent protein kinase
MIKSGTVSVVKNGVVVRSIAKYDYFGERSLIFDELRTASVVANGKVSCWTLKRNDFFGSLNENALKRIMKRIRMQDNRIKLQDLTFVRVLGKGAYGTVFLVCDKSNLNYYALKVISKEKVQKYELEQYVSSEIKILLCLDNDFILKLVHNFEDSQFIHLLTEFVKGEDLFAILRVIKNLSEDQSRFYFSCLLVIVEYLHDRDVIYRDFKPENVIVDEEGYPRLIDFGIAKMSKDRTFTVLGTPHYMAPEIILGKGYSHYADYWSLGVMLYEFTFNRLPFGDAENNPFSIYQAILDRQLSFVSMKVISKPLKALISQLLHPNPSARNSGAVHKLKAHPWLSTIHWESVLSKSLTPPYIPNVEPDGLGDSSVDLLTLISNEMVEEEF